MISANVSDGENTPSASRFVPLRWTVDLKRNVGSHCRNYGDDEQESYKHGSIDNEKKQINMKLQVVII